MRLTARLLALSAACCLGACGDSGGKLGGSLKEQYIASADIKTVLADKVTRIPGANELGVHANLVGSQEQAAQSLGTPVVLQGTMPVPEAQRYLEGIRDRLMQRWPYPPVPAPRVEVLATLNYNAEAVADDTIQVPLGVINRADSEDEIAFVVGHEMGHLLLMHQIRRENQLHTTENGAQAVAALAMVGAMIATGKRSGNTVTLQAAPSAIAAGSAMAGDTAVAEVITAIIDPGWSARQEEQADLVGTDLMTAAGYNPSAASDAFDKIIADEEKARKEADELAKQSEEAKKNAPAQISFANLLDDATHGLMVRLNKLRANHPSTQNRNQSLTDYRNRVYTAQSAQPDRPESKAPLVALRNRPQFKAALRAIDELRQADQQLTNHAPALALASARASQRDAPTWWAPAYMVALADLDLGDRPAALVALGRATQVQGAPYDAFERYADELIVAKRYREALAVLDAADTRFMTHELTMPDRIIVLRYMNNQPAAQEVTKNCNNSTNPRLRDACQRANIRVLETTTARNGTLPLSAPAG